MAEYFTAAFMHRLRNRVRILPTQSDDETIRCDILTHSSRDVGISGCAWERSAFMEGLPLSLIQNPWQKGLPSCGRSILPCLWSAYYVLNLNGPNISDMLSAIISYHVSIFLLTRTKYCTYKKHEKYILSLYRCLRNMVSFQTLQGILG